jgi:hypothetical protein
MWGQIRRNDLQVRVADVKIRVGSVVVEEHSLVALLVLHVVTREE